MSCLMWSLLPMTGIVQAGVWHTVGAQCGIVQAGVWHTVGAQCGIVKGRCGLGVWHTVRTQCVHCRHCTRQVRWCRLRCVGGWSVVLYADGIASRLPISPHQLCFLDGFETFPDSFEAKSIG